MVSCFLSLLPVACGDWAETEMTQDPEAWAALGRAIRSDRERQGLTRAELAARVAGQGGQVTSRSIGTLEEGPPPKRGTKRPSLEPTVAALGWRPGWTDRILAGEDPSAVLQRDGAVATDATPRSHLLELLPVVYDFGRTAVQAGAPASLRDDFERIVQQLIDAVPGGRSSRASYSLAAYRPHAEGEGVPSDDAARIQEAMRSTG